MDDNFLLDIYCSLQGFLIPEAAIPWVPNLFVQHGQCEQEYSRMRDAYERVCNRLEVDADWGDEDLDEMVDSLETIQQALCMQMFLLGVEYADVYRQSEQAVTTPPPAKE